MESKEQTVAWEHASDLALTETAGKSMTIPEKQDSSDTVAKSDDQLLNDLDQMNQEVPNVANDSDPLAGVTNEIEDMFASSETKSSPAPAKAEASESTLSSGTDEMHATKTEIDFPEPSFKEQQAVTLKDGDLITTTADVPLEFHAEEFSMPPSAHNNLSHPSILDAMNDMPTDEKKEGEAEVVPINEMFPTNTNKDESKQPPPIKKSSKPAEKSSADTQHLNKSPKNSFKRDNSGKSINNNKQSTSTAALPAAAADGEAVGSENLSKVEMTNQAELLAIKAKKLADKVSNRVAAAANTDAKSSNAKVRRKSKPDAATLAPDDASASTNNNRKSRDKMPPKDGAAAVVMLPDIITSPMKGTSMAKKKELMQQQRKRPTGEETKLPVIRGAQSYDDRLGEDGSVVAFSSQTPGRDNDNNHLYNRLDQAYSSPMERSSIQQDDSSVSTKKKKRKPLYLRMIARARKQTFEEERKKHEQYLLLKQKRAKNNPTREEIREHMRLHDEAMKASLAQPKANHMAHVRALKKMNSFQDNNNDDEASQATLATKEGAKSRAKLRQQLETYDQISERLDEQKKERQRAYRKKLPPVDTADGSKDPQQQITPSAAGGDESGGFMSPRKPSHPKMSHDNHPRRHQTQAQSSHSSQQQQQQQHSQSPRGTGNDSSSSSPTMLGSGNLSIEGHHAQHHEHESHVPTHHPSPRKPPHHSNHTSPKGSQLSPRVVVATEEIQTQTDHDSFVASSSASMKVDLIPARSAVASHAVEVAAAAAEAKAVEINVLEQPLLAKDDSILPDLKADFVPYYCAPDWMDMLNKTGGGRSLSR